MSETTVPVPASGRPEPARSPALKWGLVGCGVLSALLIVGLVVLSLRARDLTGMLLRKTESMVLERCTPDVTARDKADFQAAYDHFVTAATAGKVPFDRMTAMRNELADAIADGKVTPEELRRLTVSERRAVPATGGSGPTR